MKPTIYLVPRWSGTPQSDWYPWFNRELTERFQLSATILNMPNWTRPDVEESVAFLTNQIPQLGPSTYLIGHSVGCQAILRFLQARLAVDSELELGGVLFVAGWFNVDEPWNTVTPWTTNEHLNYPLMTSRIHRRKVVLSDNDPFTSDYTANAKLWTDRLGCSVSVYPNRTHFNGKVAPEILDECIDLLNLPDSTHR